MVNEILYILFQPLHIFLHYNVSQFGLAAFQAFSSQWGWLVAAVLGSTAQYNFYLALVFA